MSKNKFQDIIKIKTTQRTFPVKENFPEIRQKKNISHNMLWLIALISIIFLFFAISFLFSKAVVTINPKTKDFTINKTLTATKDASTDGLSYDLVVLSDEEKKEIKAGEEKDWEVSAKGSVLIYNTFSSKAQPLLVDTRLEGSNGKIYKTKEKVIVPGMTEGGTPGKIGVDIYGEKAGEEYNSAPLDFKILGFKGTPKYSKFYARSVGEIKGGLKGKSRQVSESEKENALKEIKDNLFAKLFQRAKDQIPENFVLLKDATILLIDEENETPPTNEGNITLGIKGTFKGILFNKDKLEKEIINASLEKNENADVYVSKMENLLFSEANKELIFLDEMKDVTFNLSGTAKVVWKVDAEKLTGELLGKSKKDFDQILSSYPSIDSALSVIRPVWESSFPEKSKKIKIIINSPE